MFCLKFHLEKPVGVLPVEASAGRSAAVQQYLPPRMREHMNRTQNGLMCISELGTVFFPWIF